MIDRMIDDNPTDLALMRTALIDDGYGGMIPDPLGSRTAVYTRGRVAELPYGAQRVSLPSITDVGVSVPGRKFVLVSAGADIREDDRLTYAGYELAVGPVEEIRRFGDVVAKQAPLQRGDEIPVET